MYKRITTLTLALLICLSVTSYAASGVTATTDIDYTTDTITISGTVEGSGEWVTMYVEGPTNRLEHIGNTKVQDGQYSTSFQLVEPVEGDYRVKIKAEGMSEAVDVGFVYKANNVTVSELLLKCEENKEYIINISDVFGISEYALTYDPTKIEVIDLCAYTYKNQLTNMLKNTLISPVANIEIIATPVVLNDGIKITNAAEGSISFDVSGTSGLSGCVNALKLRSKVNSGTTTISLIKN